MPTKPKIGICLWSLPGDNDQARIRLAHQLGFRGIEIDLGSSEQDYPLAQPKVQQRYREWQSEMELTYTTLGVIEFLKCSLSDPNQHREAHQTIDKAIDAAAAMQIPTIQLPSFGASAIKNASGFGATVDCFRYACEKARPHAITLYSENALDQANQLFLLEMVNSPNFQLCFDTANPKRMSGLDGADLLAASYDRIGEVHLKDGFLDRRPALLAEGETDFSQCWQSSRHASLTDGCT